MQPLGLVKGGQQRLGANRIKSQGFQFGDSSGLLREMAFATGNMPFDHL